jgi:ABC-2 type transport system ATP-binding protein
LLELFEDGTTILLSSHNLGEIDRVTSNILFLKKGTLIKEDLSYFEETIYFIKVDKKEIAEKVLHTSGIPVKVEKERLCISVKHHSLQQIMLLLQENSIQIVDIEKRVSGSEERYRQIFGGEE